MSIRPKYVYFALLLIFVIAVFILGNPHQSSLPLLLTRKVQGTAAPANNGTVVTTQTSAQSTSAAATVATTAPAVDPSKMAVIDVIMYNGEPLVPVRLETLNNVVDRFYIIEGTTAFSGKPKERLFKDVNAAAFEPYAHKIRWVVHEMDAKQKSGGAWGTPAWAREDAARGSAEAAVRDDIRLGNLKEPFVAIHTDADEVPEPGVVREFQPGGKHHAMVTSDITVLAMRDFYYNLNWIAKEPCIKGHTIPWHMLHKLPTSRHDPRTSRKRRIDDAGHHMSFFFDAESVRHKLETFSHQELNLPKFKTDRHIYTCFSTGLDILDRKRLQRLKWDYNQAPLPLQRFHEELCRKQHVDPATAKLLIPLPNDS